MSDQITVLSPGRAKFESLLEAAPIAMVGFDPAGVIWFVNRQAELLFDLDRDEMIGQFVELLMPRSLRRMLSGQGGSLVAHPATEAMGACLELSGRRRDGTEFPVEVNLSSTQTPDGLLVTAAVRDVTDRKKENQDLQGLAALIKYSEDAIIGKTLEGIITSWNPAAERMYGFLSPEVIGRSITLILPEGRTDEVNRILAKIKGGQPTVHLETVRVRKDGTLLPVSLTVSPVLDALGTIVGASAIARDVTQQRQAIKDARSMIESSLDSLVSISPEGMITDLNEATIKVTGVAREELIGTAFSDYFTQPDKANAIYQKVFAEGMAVDYPLTMRHRNGRLTEVLYNASVYRDAEGTVLGVFAAARDVTKQMQAFADARSMIESSLDSLVSISPEGMITDVNEATTKVTGVSRRELIGTAFSDYFTEPAKANRIYQMVFAEGMAVDYPLTIRHRDGMLTEVLYNASVYRDRKGKALGVFAAARDVTTQVQAQAEVADQLRKELERLAELEQFQRLTVGRELKMIELKKEIEAFRRHSPVDDGGFDDWN